MLGFVLERCASHDGHPFTERSKMPVGKPLSAVLQRSERSFTDDIVRRDAVHRAFPREGDIDGSELLCLDKSIDPRSTLASFACGKVRAGKLSVVKSAKRRAAFLP